MAVNLAPRPARAARAKELYAIEPPFESALVSALCGRPRLWERIGADIEADCLPSPAAKRAIEAAHAIARETERGPESTAVVLQRLRRWSSEGRVTRDEIAAVYEMFEASLDSELPSDDALVAEFAPVIRRRLESRALDNLASEFMKRGDLSQALSSFERAKQVGAQGRSLGSLIGPGSMERLAALKKVERLEFGVMEVDSALERGVPRGTETVFVAASGGGKSMALIQQCIAAAVQGFHVGYATLELPSEMIEARLIANMTGITVNAIGEPGCTDALRAGAFMERLGLAQNFGRILVGTFTPKVTTSTTLFDWAERASKEWGAPMDVLIVDYADKMSAREAGKGRSDESTYHSAGSVYEDLFVWARDNNKWVYTASQGTRVKDKRKRLDIDDVSDSMHKVRTSDVVITINGEEDQKVFFVAKNRRGKSRGEAGPLPTMFDCARIAPPSFDIETTFNMGGT